MSPWFQYLLQSQYWQELAPFERLTLVADLALLHLF